MTMPHLMNCPHREDGWCAECVREAGNSNLVLLQEVRRLSAALHQLDHVLNNPEPAGYQRGIIGDLRDMVKAALAGQEVRNPYEGFRPANRV
jgi:hypothetical protein